MQHDPATTVQKAATQRFNSDGRSNKPDSHRKQVEEDNKRRVVVLLSSLKGSVNMFFHSANGLAEQQIFEIFSTGRSQKYFRTKSIICCCLYDSLLCLDEMVIKANGIFSFNKRWKSFCKLLSSFCTKRLHTTRKHRLFSYSFYISLTVTFFFFLFFEQKQKTEKRLK